MLSKWNLIVIKLYAYGVSVLYRKETRLREFPCFSQSDKKYYVSWFQIYSVVYNNVTVYMLK